MICRLAFQNVRRARRDYLVYLLTLTLGVTVFYAFNTVSLQVDIAGVGEEGLAELFDGFLSGLTVFLAFVMGFLMVYANNFIMRRRKKEFGLYQVLGMSRWQTARVMAFETALVALAALVFGIVLGVALSQVMIFFTASLFRTQIQDFHFFFSLDALRITVICLACIFLVTLVFNLRVVARARVVDLMGAGRRNERIHMRNPWLSGAVFLAGTAAIGVAYGRLLADGLPIDGSTEALTEFGITTAFVVMGTLLFFFGLSGVLLRAIQGLPRLYWRGLAPFTLRQLASRVNTVSASLAVIALVLFLAFTGVATGTSIAGVMNENLDVHTPVDYSRMITYFDGSEDTLHFGGENGDEEVYSVTVPTEPVDAFTLACEEPVCDEDGELTGEIFDLPALVGEHFQLDGYSSTPTDGSEPVIALGDLAAAAGSSVPRSVEESGFDSISLGFIKESDYNRYLAFRGLPEVSLGSSGYLITCDAGTTLTDIYNAALAGGAELELAGRKLEPAVSAVDLAASAFANSSMGCNMGYLVVPDEVVDELDLPLYESFLLMRFADGVSAEDAEREIIQPRAYDGLVRDESGNIVGSWGMEATRLSMYRTADSMNGLISYLAIYIGFVLVVAAAAILAIQQLSAVADAGRSVHTLSQIGTPGAQICRSFLMQQAVLFLFPLVVGAAHAAVALSVIIDLVELFGGLTIGATVGVAAAIFAAAYGGYFLVTWSMSRPMLK